MQLTDRELGDWGEKKAAHFLKKRGYRIIERNYYTRRGEIDLVARRQDLLAFVEVKTRRSLKFGPPRAAVDKYKQQKIKQAARYFLVQQQKQHLQFRFDVIAIVITGDRGKLYHLTNAF